LLDDNEYLIRGGKCECGVYDKIGICCEHVIYVNRVNGEGYMNEINERWMIMWYDNSIWWDI
jgi:hypothetical protein